MAKFVLEIDLATLPTPDALADALAKLADDVREIACSEDEMSHVMNSEGAVVGKWEIQRPVTIEQLGTEFVRILRSWASDEEWARMLSDNADEDSDYVCHSHDFCDANEAMAEAFHNLHLKTCFDVSDQGEETPEYMAANKLWNDAWDWAKTHHLTAHKN